MGYDSGQHKAAQDSKGQHKTAQLSTAQHTLQNSSAAQHSTAQNSSAAQHSTAQHSTAQHSTHHSTEQQCSTAQQSTAQYSTPAQHGSQQACKDASALWGAEQGPASALSVCSQQKCEMVDRLSPYLIKQSKQHTQCAQHITLLHVAKLLPAHKAALMILALLQ